MDQRTVLSEPPEIREIGARLREDLALLSSAVQRRGEALSGTVTDLVDRHPFGTLAAAFGVGYALSGGPLRRMGGRLVRVGLRLGLAQLVDGVLAGRGAPAEAP